MGLSQLKDIIKRKHMRDDLVLNYNKEVVGISSGSLTLDNACGGYGIAIKGAITEIVGQEGSSKTTLSLQCAAQAQKRGLNVLFLDFEQTFDYNYARSLGLNTDDDDTFMCLQPMTLEEGSTILTEYEKVAEKNNECGNTLIVIDSVAAAKPEELLKNPASQQRVGIHAQRWGQFAAYLNLVWCGRYKAYVLATNQIRSTISNVNPYAPRAVKDSGVGFGIGDSSKTTTGGSQWKYLCSLRLMLDYAGKIEVGSFSDGDLERTGSMITAKVIKNKVAPPFKTCKYAVIFGKGTDDSFAILETLKRYEVITNAGAMFYYTDSKNNEVGEGLSFKMKGKDAFYEKLKEPQYQEDMKLNFDMILSQESRNSQPQAEVEPQADFDDEA